MRIGTRLGLEMLCGILLCASAYGQIASRPQRDLFAAVNKVRQEYGLPALRWDTSLAVAAQRHAVVMTEHWSAQHQFEGEPSLSARVKQAGGHFSWLAENVTQGPNYEFIHEQFMHSPSHRANILDREMNSIGIGVVERGGQLFAVEDFSQVK